jgi:hypothetical protein
MVWLLLMGGSVLERRACISGSLIPQGGAKTANFCSFLADFAGPPRLAAPERSRKRTLSRNKPAIWFGPSDYPQRSLDMRKKFRSMVIATAAMAGLAMASTAEAAPHGVKVGELTRNAASGWDSVFGSSKNLHCTYRPSGHPREHCTISLKSAP